MISALREKEWKPRFVWELKEVFWLYLFLAFLIFALLNTPNSIWDPENRKLVVTIGAIGIWRYSWWLLNLIRALIYQYVDFPRLREKADSLWESGWRPPGIHIMIVTYNEDPYTTNKVFSSLIRETRRIGVPATVYMGTATDWDEEEVTRIVDHYAGDIDFKVIFIRQAQPGKRRQIGGALRALSRNGVRGDMPVLFMDGDTILSPGCLEKCLPLFPLNPRVDALTVHGKAFVFGSRLFQEWYDLRFAQRNLMMHSHALSRKVMTLTGRMSMFRASKIVTEEFISRIESDHLKTWLWGKFSFLSGDDKSTWFCLLKDGSQMLYVPDTIVWTIERIDGRLMPRIWQNLLRWSGNMLRNNGRAIALGPQRTGAFIWWVLIDQRLSMWTSMISPLALITAGFFISPAAFYMFVIWILVTRFMLSLALFHFHGRIRMTFPFILYPNQVIGAIVKIYISFRLPLQRWSNRGIETAASGGGLNSRLRWLMARYITALYVSLLFVFILLYMNILQPPTMESLRVMLNLQ